MLIGINNSFSISIIVLRDVDVYGTFIRIYGHSWYTYPYLYVITYMYKYINTYKLTYIHIFVCIQIHIRKKD
jgi:hypothetical protein